VVDYDQVVADIVGICSVYDVPKIAVDTGFQGHHSAQDLQKRMGEDGIVAFRQGVLSMAAPFRELLEMIRAGKAPDSQGTHQCRIYHDGNPVLRWMVSNVTAEERGGLIKPSKDRSSEKIDGVTAATMAIGVGITLEPTQPSVYETRGIRTL
jgi:phage terminase large subunit-like protein